MISLQQNLFEFPTPRGNRLMTVTRTAEPVRFACPTYDDGESHGLDKRIRGVRIQDGSRNLSGEKSAWDRLLELSVEEGALRKLLGTYGCTSRKELAPERVRAFTSELSRMIREALNA